MTSARTSPLDLPLHVTFFNDQFAQTKAEQTTTLRELVEPITHTTAPSKQQLPWLKLARFGDTRTQRGSLRHDENVKEISGIEADYDGERITLEQAEATLRAAGIAALLYTSPSHTPAAPRWRVLCPTSAPLAPAMRGGLVARLNGLFGGALAGESFTLSQAYYYGSVAGSLHHTVALVEGEAIDLATRLDAGAIGRQVPARKEASRPLQVRPWDNKTAAPGKPWATATVTPPADASAYGEAALRGACDDLRHAHDGGKHHAVNKAGWSVGGLVSAGEVLDGDAWRALNGALAAILPRCEDQRAAQRTLANAYREGKGKPRDVPEAPAVVEAIHPAQGMLDIINRAAAAKPLAIGADIMDVDGVLKMLVDECTRTAIRPQPFLALGAAICAVGVLAGRKYRTATDLRTNVYIAAIAESGGGKDHAAEIVRRAIDESGLERYLGGETIASGRAVLSSLENHPARLFQVDEFGMFLASVTGKKAAPYKAEIWSELMKLYSRAKGVYRGTEYANKKEHPRIDINQPCVAFYATSTPSTFWAALEGGALLDGSLARFLLFITDDNRPDRNLEPGIFKPSDRLLDALRAIAYGAGGAPAPGNLPAVYGAEMTATEGADPFTVHFTAAAKALHEQNLGREDDWARKVQGTPQASIVNRLGENAAKLALIRAVSRDPASPSITERDISWGWAVSEHSARSMIREANDNIADTTFHKNVQACIKSVKKHGPVTQSEMFKKGWTIPRKEQSEILIALVESGQIIATSQEAGKAGGRPTVRYSIGAT